MLSARAISSLCRHIKGLELRSISNMINPKTADTGIPICSQSFTCYLCNEIENVHHHYIYKCVCMLLTVPQGLEPSGDHE